MKEPEVAKEIVTPNGEFKGLCNREGLWVLGMILLGGGEGRERGAQGKAGGRR